MDRVLTTLKTKYAKFDGRARRKEYWFFVLFELAAQCLALAVDAIVFGGVPLVYWIVALGLFVPSIAVSFRRLHDIDKSAWWMLIILVPIAGALVLLWFTATPGTKGPNRFGPDPIEDEEAAGDPAVVI